MCRAPAPRSVPRPPAPFPGPRRGVVSCHPEARRSPRRQGPAKVPPLRAGEETGPGPPCPAPEHPLLVGAGVCEGPARTPGRRGASPCGRPEGRSATALLPSSRKDRKRRRGVPRPAARSTSGAGDGRRGRQPPPGAEGRTASPRQRVGCREPCGAQEHWAQGHGDQVQTCALPPWPSPTCCTPARAALRPSLPVLDSATPRVPPPVATGTQGGKVWPGQADPRGLVLGVTHPVASTLAGGGGPNGAGPASPTESPEGVPGSARPGTRTSPTGWPRSPSARTLALSPDGPGVHSGIAGASDVAPAITRHLLSGQTFPNGDAARATALRRP